MKTIYIHIGTPKTGTTHLQAYFSHNREKLRQDGVCYLADKKGLTVQGVALSLGFWEEHDPTAYHESVDWFRGQLKEALASSADRIVISTEMFCEALAHRRPMLIRRLHAMLTSCGAARMVVVCYVRRQDLFVESRQANDIGRWGVSPPVSDIDPETIVNYADYYKLLSEYREVFGKQIVVRPFEKDQLVNGDVLDDFLQVIGLTRSPDYALPVGKDHNRRLRGDLLELLRVYNASGLGEGRDYGLVPLRFLPSLFTPEQASSGPGARFLSLSKSKRTEILKRYAASNRKVAIEFLGRKDGKLFRDPVVFAHKDPLAGKPLQLEEMAPLVVHMATGLFAQLEPVRARVGALEGAGQGLSGRVNALDGRVNDERRAAEARIAALESSLRDAIERCTRLEEQQQELRWKLVCLEGKKLIGWGTGSAFRSHYARTPVPLAYIIDNDAGKWGRRLQRISIDAPERLAQEDPREVAIVVYSSSFDAIAAQIARYGAFTVVPSELLVKQAPSQLATPRRRVVRKLKLPAA